MTGTYHERGAANDHGENQQDIGLQAESSINLSSAGFAGLEDGRCWQKYRRTKCMGGLIDASTFGWFVRESS